VGRRGGGSLSPRAIVRVGGGGSLLTPNSFRSLSPLDDGMGCERLGRGGGIDPDGSSPGEMVNPRRTGSGGGDANRFGAEEEIIAGSARAGDTGGRLRGGGGRGGGLILMRDERDTVGLGSME